jgi:hypothetical protein
MAVLLVGVAATVSRRRHTGRFANQNMEALLRELSDRLPMRPADAGTTRSRRDDGRASALYVMTSSYAHGGHTRLVCRWISMQPETASSVVLTREQSPAPPPDLVEAVRRSGGDIHRLDGGTTSRAGALRSLAGQADMVVLAAHENDIVPSLALASRGSRPPVVLLNHAEHVFWVGSSVADVVVSLRPAASELAVRRRGIPDARALQVPMPLPVSPRTRSIGEAKQALGIGAGQRLLVTVGWAYKFAPLAGRDLISALDRVLAQPDVHLIAVGPTESREPWASARSRYGERVRAVGPRDTHAVLEAADVYVESFPIGSLTASLEAGMLGVPVVGLSLDAADWPLILQEDDPSLVDHIFTDLGRYQDHIRMLLDDADARREAGRTVQAGVEQWHGVGAWATGLEQVHAAMQSAVAARTDSPATGTGEPGPEDEILATLIADTEDKISRAELHFVRETRPQAKDLELLNTRMEQLDALILGADAPRSRQYAAAISIARSVLPWRLRLRTAFPTAVSASTRR